MAVNLAGGTHHAFRHRGEGFCVFNDSAVAIRALQAERLVERALIIDTDVHQGNGTASIFAEDPTVFTFSIRNPLSTYSIASRLPIFWIIASNVVDDFSLLITENPIASLNAMFFSFLIVRIPEITSEAKSNSEIKVSFIGFAVGQLATINASSGVRSFM